MKKLKNIYLNYTINKAYRIKNLPLIVAEKK